MASIFALEAINLATKKWMEREKEKIVVMKSLPDFTLGILCIGDIWVILEMTSVTLFETGLQID
jgi:hypothetical protein